MLQTSLHSAPSGEDAGRTLSALDLYLLLKRRWLAFLIPFVVVSVIGLIAVLLWPARYLAEGKLLVESQQIPSDLVKATVSTLASERIQVIEQRINTRENLLTIANKYGLTGGWKERLSGTEVVDFMRQRLSIKPLELKIPARQNNRQAIAFTVGFEYENAVIATRVANDLVTMILNEDVKTRTNYAAETTKFLEREAKKLEGNLDTIGLKISELKRREALGLPSRDVNPNEAQLAALKGELVQKSSIYSPNHPDIKSLKARVEAMEKTVGPVAQQEQQQELGLDALLRQQEALQKEVDATNVKLSAARLGESLERGQQSERLEVIEQPSLPQKPVAPNRPKLMIMVLAAAAALGGGLVFLLENLDGTIRRTADLGTLLPAELLVTIPYIATQSETKRQASLRRNAIIVTASVALVAVVTAVFFLPIDELWAALLNRFSN